MRALKRKHAANPIGNKHSDYQPIANIEIENQYTLSVEWIKKGTHRNFAGFQEVKKRLESTER